MGLFGIGKKKDDDPLRALQELENETNSNFGNDQDYGQQFNQQQNFDQQGIGQNPDIQFNQQQEPQKFDSFGNPMRSQSNQNISSAIPDQYNSPQSQDNSKDLQLIIAKLDAIKSEMTNISHRLEMLENQNNQQPQQNQRRYKW
ncbi:hypothetical protein K9L67_03220 [Candidatus Woesearchaeota archaeon]|nr:hypothetical protein [Candidatus Woesearchaeota archaeon]MCF7901212.1 hypothetical protein [Candidatus Woesearchaeota archaeon]MCF8013693.1 hypothetical protein [Candidatus Woesearchaeota archaeon]